MLVALVAFLLIGPYSYLAGAISLDFGGKRGGATACGIIDGVGYLFGSVVAGKVVASLSVALGWQGVFVMLAVVAAATAVVAACFLVDQVRSSTVGSSISKVQARSGRGSGLMQIVEEILDLFAKKGAAAYHGEAVSQEEHALQAAELAEREGVAGRPGRGGAAARRGAPARRPGRGPRRCAASTAGTRRPAAPG